jgi:hypothetical protein
VLIDIDGTVDSAPGQRLVAGTAGAHSLWSDGGNTYCIRAGILNLFNGSSFEAIGAMADDSPADYCELNGDIVVSTRNGLKIVRGGKLIEAAMPTVGFVLSATNRGGLLPGRYGVAVSLRGDIGEGGLSSMLMVDVPDGGGLLLDLPSHPDADAVSVYRTDANGGMLYRAVDAPPGMTSYLIGAGSLGSEPATARLGPLPGGQIVRAWKGLLLVARGRHLYFSSALRYGLHNPTTDFISMATAITAVMPVNDGVYLSDGTRTYWLAGTSPADWRITTTDFAAAPLGAGVVVDGSLFDGLPSVPVACWITHKGFALGLPDGQVVMAQEKRLRLPMPDRGWLVSDGRRLFTGS